MGEEAPEKTRGAVPHTSGLVWPGALLPCDLLPGHTTIETEVLSNWLYDIIKSLSSPTANKIIISTATVLSALSGCSCAHKKAHRSELGCTVKIFDPAYMSKDIVKKLDSGPLVMQEEIGNLSWWPAIPALVHLWKAVDNPIKDTRFTRLIQLMDTHAFAICSKHFRTCKKTGGKSPAGAQANQSKADAERGQIYHDHLGVETWSR